jgi:ABC-type uncharacterized transport system YnjBCD substrate-binding protein
MQRIGIVIATAAAITIGAAPAGAQQQVTLNLVTAGDQNMVDYVKDYLGPMFEKEHPGVTVRAVGTGPGDAGSQKIYEKLEAEKANSSWDIDVAVIHQKAAGEMAGKGLLARYAPNVSTGKLVTAEAAKRALGADVDGYVMPMFNSQTAIAYNTAMVKEPPSTYAELEKWVQQNPKKFGYNGITGGMSGGELRRRLALRQHPRRRPADQGPLRSGQQKSLGPGARPPSGVQQKCRSNPRQCRDTGHAQSR